MTREQEIKRRLFEISTSNFNNSVVDSGAYFAGYIDGAKWADETMINKVCEWLKNYAHMYVSETTGDLNEDDLINAFRNAMKGEQI